MPSWDHLFKDERFRFRMAEADVHRFVEVLERRFDERPLRLWDLCCGAGRHTVQMARLGHDIYASDISERGIANTRDWLEREGLEARTAISDMNECPWPDKSFQGVVCWDSLHHNTLVNIKRTVEGVHDALCPGGLFLVTLASTKTDSYGTGREIEPNTYVRGEGDEEGVPHHFFSEQDVVELFQDWEILVLLDRTCDYRIRGKDFLDTNPFTYTKWGVVAQKRTEG